MLRAIREIAPRYVVGENVLGLVNWNGGMVFDEVQSDLEAQGYEVQPYILPAASVNAPHRRERVWFVAYSNHARTDFGMRSNQNGEKENKKRSRESRIEFGQNGGNGINPDTKSKSSERMQPEQREPSEQEQGKLRRNGSEMDSRWNDSHSNNKGLQGSQDKGGIRECGKERNKQPTGLLLPNWENFPTKSPVRSGNDGFSGRLDGITFPKWRNESIKAAGNAIVPQVAHQIFKAIEQYERL